MSHGAGPGSRLNQVCEWLGGEDYLIVLDECHRQVACNNTYCLSTQLCSDYIEVGSAYTYQSASTAY